jgi:hypothetical protein
MPLRSSTFGRASNSNGWASMTSCDCDLSPAHTAVWAAN